MIAPGTTSVKGPDLDSEHRLGPLPARRRPARRPVGHRAGGTDLVSFAKLFLANPDLPRRLKLGAVLNAPDPETVYGGDARGYSDYPALGKTAGSFDAGRS